MLAGVVGRAVRLLAVREFDLARERERHVLDRMVESGYVTRRAGRRGLRRTARA